MYLKTVLCYILKLLNIIKYDELSVINNIIADLTLSD